MADPRHYKIELENGDSFVIETDKTMLELSAECKSSSSVSYYDCIKKADQTVKSKDVRSFERLYQYSFERELKNDRNNARGKGSRRKAEPLP